MIALTWQAGATPIDYNRGHERFAAAHGIDTVDTVDTVLAKVAEHPEVHTIVTTAGLCEFLRLDQCQWTRIRATDPMSPPGHQVAGRVTLFSIEADVLPWLVGVAADPARAGKARNRLANALRFPNHRG